MTEQSSAAQAEIQKGATPTGVGIGDVFLVFDEPKGLQMNIISDTLRGVGVRDIIASAFGGNMYGSIRRAVEDVYRSSVKPDADDDGKDVGQIIMGAVDPMVGGVVDAVGRLAAFYVTDQATVNKIAAALAFTPHNRASAGHADFDSFHAWFLDNATRSNALAFLRYEFGGFVSGGGLVGAVLETLKTVFASVSAKAKPAETDIENISNEEDGK